VIRALARAVAVHERVKEPRHGVRISSGRVPVNFAQIDRIAIA
jgi:hypothetical protein